MTLTGMLPTLRRSLPDPMREDIWPSGSVPSLDDVRISGVSLLAEADRIGVPMIHGDGVRVIAVGRVVAHLHGVDDRIDLVVCLPDDLAYVWAEARLLGRISTAPAGDVRVSTPSRRQSARTALPLDSAVGDLLAIPFVRA